MRWMGCGLCRRPDAKPLAEALRPQRRFAGGEWVAESTGGQISSRLLSMRSASALLELPRVRHALCPTRSPRPYPIFIPSTLNPASAFMDLPWNQTLCFVLSPPLKTYPRRSTLAVSRKCSGNPHYFHLQPPLLDLLLPSRWHH